MSKVDISGWNDNFNKFIKFVEDNDKLPNSKSANEDEKVIGKWYQNTLQQFKKVERIMKQKEIYDLFKNYLDDNPEYFLSKKELFIKTVEDCKKFILENKKRPNKNSSNDEEKRLGLFISRSLHNYKNKLQILKENDMRKIWNDFATEFESYLLDNIEIFYKNLNDLRDFIDANNKLPSRKIGDEDEKRLAEWIYMCVKLYKNNEEGNFAKGKVREDLEEFIKQNKKLFKNFEL